MKKILYTILCGLPMMVMAQKVGINTDEPKQTLDVEGTMRIKTLGKKTTNSSPLAWSPVVGDDQGRIMLGADENYKPFRVVRYKFHIKGGEAEDWLNGANLQIPTDKYTVMIMRHKLIDDQGHPVLLRLLRSNDDQTNIGPIFLDAASYRGYPWVSGDPNDPYNDRKSLKTYPRAKVVFSSPMVMVYPLNGNWVIYADYPGVKPVSYNYVSFNPYKVAEARSGESIYDLNKKYTWDITFLIVDNAYMKALDLRTITLNPNSDTGSSTVDAVTGEPR